MNEVIHELNLIIAKGKFRIRSAYRIFVYNVVQRYLTQFAYYILQRSRKWNPVVYDRSVGYLYRKVMVRKAFSYKVSTLNLGKKYKNITAVIIETPEGKIQVEISRKKDPHLFVKSNTNS